MRSLRSSSFRPWWRRAVLAASLVAIVFPILACSSEGGERARDDGGCPMGETCSPLTPAGMRFSATPLSDTVGDIPRLAAPGRTTIGFTPIGSYELPDFAVEVGSGLEARSAQRVDVDTGTVEILARATTEGSLVRVLAADESGLLDRVELVAHEVDRRGLRPYVGLFQSLGGPFEGGIWRYWHELPSLTVLATLHDDEGARLVDESLPMSASVGEPAAVEDDARTWDTLSLDVDGTTSVDVTVGTTVFTLQSVDAVDSIVQLPQADEGSLLRDAFVCFVARSGAVPVLGAPLTYQWESEDASFPLGRALETFPFVEAPCVAIPEGTGTRSITITGPEGLSASFDVTLRERSGELRSAIPNAGRDGQRAGG